MLHINFQIIASMRYIILPLCALCVMIVFQSCKQTVSEKQEEVVSECLREKNEGVSMKILKKMECLYGDDISGGKAFSVDSKSCPDYIGGVYLDDSGRLVIQIKGDSLVVRKRLEKELGMVDFIIEPGLCYTQKELLRINDELVRRWRELEGTPVMKNVQSAGVCIHDIQIDLMVNTPEKQQEFREKVMDSPAFRFIGSREAVLNDEEGVNDVAGVSIRPEYTVYSTEADKVKFIIYNHSGELLHCGTRYVITYEDVDGTWRELPINNIFLDTEYGVSNEERWEFVVDLYPDVHPNRAGRYRFFYDVSLGDVGFGRKIGMMTEFYLSDKPEELERAVKTPVPEVLLKGMTEKEYYERERRRLEDRLRTEVFTLPDKMPDFQGKGAEGFMDYITSVIPEGLDKEGRSVIAFIIERDGSVNDVRVLRSSGDEQLDTEALRIIKSSPKWLPGEYRKQPVRVQYIVPVNFRK